MSALSRVLLAKVLGYLRAMLPSHLILNFLTHPGSLHRDSWGRAGKLMDFPGPSSLVYILSSTALEGAG